MSIRQSPHQQQSAVRQTRPQSNVASVVLSNVSRINSKWSYSTTCWEFFRQFLSAITLNLYGYFVKYDRLWTDSFLWLTLSAAYGCYGIYLSWYPVLSKLASYKCQYWRLCRFCVPKNIDIGRCFLKLFENFLGVRVFLNHSVVSSNLGWLDVLTLSRCLKGQNSPKRGRKDPEGKGRKG